MPRLDQSELPSLHRHIETFLSDKGSYEKPLFTLHKSSNRHTLCQYQTAGSSALDLKWILTRKQDDGSYHMTFEDVNPMHALFLGADISNNEIKLRAPVSIDAPMNLALDEEGTPMIVSDVDGRTAILDQIYVNMDTPSAVEVLAHGLDAESGANVRSRRVVDLSGFPLE